MVQNLETKAQNTIDILVRNLFERTADIGFLSTDQELLAAAKLPDQLHNADSRLAADTRARLHNYVAKYSVYQNVVLLDAKGRVLIDRLGHYSPADTVDWLPGKINAATAYFEHYGTLLPQEQVNSLIYAWKMEEAGKVVGFVALLFNLQEESKALFARILPEQDQSNWTLCGVIDASNQVVFSSDEEFLGAGKTLKVKERDGLLTCQIGPTSYLTSIKTP
ncbi:MAG: hypothetical protein HC848_05000 [Limnobacter sp.]|nr:hypothetical protein [Limnobacter sp.]